MNLHEYNGSDTHAPSLSQKVVSIVDAQTANQASIEQKAVFVTLNHSHVKDPETNPKHAVHLACERGDLVRYTVDGTARLAIPSVEAFREALGGNPTLKAVQDAIENEVDGPARREYIGKLNEIADKVREAQDK